MRHTLLCLSVVVAAVAVGAEPASAVRSTTGFHLDLPGTRINGACYEHDEAYKGFQGNNHFRGLTVLHEVEDGFGIPMPVSLRYLKEKYK